MTDASGATTPPEIVDHYRRFDESSRLADESFGRLEQLRSQQILNRILPPPPATIVDVGSGPGIYSVWLAERGYAVHAVDPVEMHIDQAHERAASAGVSLASGFVGDARAIALPSGTADVVLLMGPLYHLQEPADRLRALSEARRILRSHGALAAAAVSRFASTLDGLDRGFIDDAQFRLMLDATLETGRHHNPTDDPTYFTTAYFHLADELADEISHAGFDDVEIHAVEGIAWLAPDFAERLADPAKRAALLNLADRLGREPSLIGVSPHLLATGRVP